MPAEDGSPETLVLICADTGLKTQDLDWLRTSGRRVVSVQVVPHLCRRSEAIGAAVASGPADRLVLGLCAGEYAEGELQAQIRKAGLDPLGVEVVLLRPAGPTLPAGKTARLLAAAAARARAFAGSGPEHAKPYLSARMSRRALLGLSLKAYRAAPAIQAVRCAADLGCQLCAAACPRGALTWTDGRMELDKAVCEPCGVCVTACPRGAMVDPSTTPAQLAAQVQALLSPGSDPGPRGVYYTCRSGPPAGGSHPQWLPVQVPCVNMLTPSWLLAPLALGAAAVGVVRCRCGGVSARGGGREDGVPGAAAGGVEYCRALLQKMNAPPELVRWDPDVDQPPAIAVGVPKSDVVAADPDLGDHSGFGHLETARVLLALAQVHGADPDVALDHPQSPMGVVTIRADVCTGCGMCALACPTGALGFRQHEAGVTLTFAADLCNSCGQCLRRCPERETGAISVTRKTDLDLVRRGRDTIYQQESARCVACGGRMAPDALLRRITGLLGAEGAATTELLTSYCPACRAAAPVWR